MKDEIKPYELVVTNNDLVGKDFCYTAKELTEMKHPKPKCSKCGKVMEEGGDYSLTEPPRHRFIPFCCPDHAREITNIVVRNEDISKEESKKILKDFLGVEYVQRRIDEFESK